MRRAIYPGSFDPVTNGHLDIIERGCKLFDEIIIGILVNPDKQPLFTVEERQEMLTEALNGINKGNCTLRVDSFSGLLVNYAVAQHADVIVRGIRAISDYEYELQMALMNRRLQPDIETVFMMPAEIYSYVSSRLVKEVFHLGGVVTGLVPPLIEKRMKEKVESRMKTWPVMSPFPVSENVARMQSSATMAAMQAAEALRASGADVCDFGAGEPDFDTPDNIKQAAERAMRAGRTKYTANAGIRELQRAIIDFYQREFGAEYQPSEVMATAGGKQAIFNAVVTLLNPGDEALIPKPYWVTFPEIAVFAGAKPVFIETEDTNFVLTADQVERAITPRTKLLILNSPSNPSGRVLPPAEFRKIMELTSERGIYVVSDECYLRFVYPPGEVFSAASLPAELRSRLCIAGSFSKTYAMTGWRVGYALAPADWTKAMLKVQGHSTSNTNSIAQWAAVEALTGPQESVRIMLAEYTRRREWLLNALCEIPGFKCSEPEGAFYAFPDVRGCLNKTLKTSGDFARQLLEEEQTVVTDGAGFGAEGYLRISYATSMKQIQEGVKRIKRFAERYS